MLKQRKNTFLYYISGALLALISAFIFAGPIFARTNFFITDQIQQVNNPESEIVIVGIDDASLQEIGSWPWEYERFATVLTKLNDENPAVVGIDVLFLEPRANLEQLQASIDAADYPVVLASKIIDNDILLRPITGETIDNQTTGFVNFFPDEDGKIRRTSIGKKVATLAGSAEKTCEKSFAVEVVKQYLHVDDQTDFCGDDLNIRSQKFPLNEDGELIFTYTKSNYEYISFKDLYNGGADSAYDLEGKVVLIGSTAIDLRSNLNDNFTSISGDSIAGVQIHGNIANSFLTNEFRNTLNASIYTAISLMVSLISLVLYKLSKKSFSDFLIFCAMLTVINVLGLLIYDTGIDWPFVQISASIIVIYIFMVIYKYLIEVEEGAFVKQAFSQYINPKLLGQLLSSPEKLKLGGERKDLTVMFSDVRGFTNISEKLTPTELVHLLNAYLEEMSTVVLANDGTIDKFIGDAIMAIWNAPLTDSQHRAKALRTAREMSEKLVEFNSELPESTPKLNIGIGINTGDAVVGNIGSSKRFDYTVLGDNVNLASRLEGLTKKYGVLTLVTESVLEGVDLEKENMLARQVDEVIVKGRTKSVKIYELLLYNKDNKRLTIKYAKAFALYQSGKFKEAETIFTELAHEFNADPPSKLMLERIADVRKQGEIDKIASNNWTGIWSWLEK